MENTNNWFKIIIAIAVLVVAISFGYYLFSIPRQQGQMSNFIKNLPMGDVNSQKCKELIDAKNTDLTFWLGVSNSKCASATNPKDKSGYCSENNDLVDSKYIYSHKLCLAEIHNITYTSLFGFTDDFYIIDLGSNNVFAQRVTHADQDNYYLYSQKQGSPIIFSDIWSEIQKMK